MPGTYHILCVDDEPMIREILREVAASGEAGVRRAIEILRTDLVRTLKLLGCPSAAALDRSYVGVPPEWAPGREPVSLES